MSNPLTMQEFNSWVGKIHLRKDSLPTPVLLGFPCGSAGEESACNVEDLGSIPGLGRSPGEGIGHPLQCSGLENSMDSIDHGVTKSRTQLSNFHLMVKEFREDDEDSSSLHKMKTHWDFPGDPVVKTLHFYCKGHRFDPQ